VYDKIKKRVSAASHKVFETKNCVFFSFDDSTKPIDLLPTSRYKFNLCGARRLLIGKERISVQRKQEGGIDLERKTSRSQRENSRWSSNEKNFR